MTATLATLPVNIILSISAFLSNPLDLLSLSQTCRSAFLASQGRASYWSKLVPAAHLARPAPWNSYTPSELRDAHIRYAATCRRWESPLPTFKPPICLPPPQGPNGFLEDHYRWRLIRGTRWAWSIDYSAGEVNFCDLRSGLVIGKWRAGSRVIDAFIESRLPDECVLCYWRANRVNNINEEFEIVATSVTFEQENHTLPTTMSFRTIQRVKIEKGTSLANNSIMSPMVIWRDYLIGSYARAQHRTHGLFLWNMRANTIFYFEMESSPRCTKVVDAVLFVDLDRSGARRSPTFRCIHLPSLVISTRLPGGSLSLTRNAFTELLPKCIMKSPITSRIPVKTSIHSIPACSPTHPRYCFIIKRFLEHHRDVEWVVFEVEVDLSIPGPIKIFSRVSQQYSVQRPTIPVHDTDDDLLVDLPTGRGSLPRASLGVRFLRVGKPGKGRVARLGGIDKMHLSGIHLDREAGFVMLWAEDSRYNSARDYFYICWLDEEKPGNMVYSRTKELISGWSRGFRWHF